MVPPRTPQGTPSQCGWLLEAQELAVHEAIQAAFDLV
jgi:hypothetical protein